MKKKSFLFCLKRFDTFDHLLINFICGNDSFLYDFKKSNKFSIEKTIKIKMNINEHHEILKIERTIKGLRITKHKSHLENNL